MPSGSIYHNRLKIFQEEVSLYPVTCEKLARGRSDVEWLDAVLEAGVRIVQLRDKVSDDKTLYEKAKIFRRKTREADALFIVNNRLDIAILTEADGIHLGNNDIPAEEARRLAPDLIIGVSANTARQAASAEDRGASYFNIGPLFPTDTKNGLHNFIGLEAVKEYSLLSPLPFTVMGGIQYNHIPDLVEEGVRRIAVVTALTQADDIKEETSRWLTEIKRQQEARIGKW